MDKFENVLIDFITNNNIKAEHLRFEQSCHSVQEAAKAVGTAPENFVKNICMIDNNGNLIVAIVKGEDRASTSRVAKALNIERPRAATAQEILERTGYPCGGVPSFGYKALFFIDTRVMEKDVVYTGGGSPNSLVKISTSGLQNANNARIVRVRK